MSLLGPSSVSEYQKFTRFTINGRTASNNRKNAILKLANTNRVGTFQPTDNSSILNKYCDNTVSEADELEKSEVLITWTAPTYYSGCVAISAMVYENPKSWFPDDNKLTKIICEYSRT